jgi:exopolysaccharide production protein ExoQ
MAARRSKLAGKASAGLVILLGLLFALIFYQNLPAGFGLNAPAVQQTYGAEENTGVTTANSKDRFIKICMILVSLIVIGSRWSLLRSMGKHINIGFAAFMVLIPMSALWSIDSNATIMRFISLASIVLVCFAISLAGWHRQRFQQIVIPPLLFVLVASLVMGMLYPDRIIEIGTDLSQKDAWHGITLTKNQFGMAASLAAIIFANRWLAGQGRAMWSIAGTVLSFVCLLLSRSNTSLFATLVCVMFMAMVMRVPFIRQNFSPHVVIGIAAVLLLYEAAIQNVIPGAYTLLSPIRSLTGKDGSLSGRTIIWDIIKEHIQAAPYLGSGYAAYWLGPIEGTPSYVFVYRMFFYPSESHNGYLEIVNDLGYLGLFVLMIFIVVYMRQGILLMRTDRSQAALYLGLLFQQLVMNMSESEWFARDNVFAIIILGVMCLSRALYESRQQHTAASVRQAPAPRNDGREVRRR